MKHNRYILGWLTILITMLFCTGFFEGNKAKKEYRMGVESYNEKDYKKGLTHLKKALEFKPGFKQARDLKPWLNFKLNQIKEAEKDFSNVLKKDPENINAVHGMAWVYFVKAKYDKSEDLFKKQRALAEEHISHPDFDYYLEPDKMFFLSIRSWANFGLGLLAEKRGFTSYAIEYYQKALADPNKFIDKSKIPITLSELFIANKKYMQAARVLEEAVDNLKKPGHLLLLRTGWAHFQAGEYQKATQSFKSSLEIKADTASGLYGLGFSLYKLDKIKKAKNYFKKAIKNYPYYMDGLSVYSVINAQPSYQELWKNFGLAYYRLGNYPAASFKLSLYLNYKPDDYEALIASAWSHRWTGFLVEAKNEFDRSIEISKIIKPDDAGPYVGLGSTYLAAGKLLKAGEEFQNALSVDSNNADAYNGLGHYYLKTGDKRKARESFDAAIEIMPDHFDSISQLAGLFFTEKDYSNAAAHYNKLIKINPYLVAPHNLAGWCAYYMERYEAAIKEFKISKKLNPYLADCYYGTGLTLHDQGKKDKAKREFATAIKIAPLYAHTKHLEKLISENPGWDSLRLTLGWSYYRFRLYHLALKAFESTGKASESGWEPARGKAWCHYWLGRYDMAQALFRELIQQNSEDVDAMIGKGWVLFNKKEYDDSMTIMEQVINKNPRLTKCWRTIAAIHHAKGNYAQERLVYDKIKQLEPKSIDVHNSTGWSFYKQRNYVEAIKAFNKSIELAPNFGESHYGTGVSHFQIGKIEEAGKELKKAIYLYPGFMDGNAFYDILDSDKRLSSLTNDMGWSYFYKLHYQAALFHFNRSLKKQPDFEGSILGKGASLYMLGKYKEAVQTYSQLTGKVPDSGKYWDKWSYMILNTGWSHYYMKDYKNAAVSFVRLEKYHSGLNYIAPLNGLGWCALKLGDSKKARELFSRSLETLPGNYQAEKGMATILDELNHKKMQEK